MKKAILATKVGMTQIFNEDGQLIPVTVLQAGPCVVTQVKTEENDGYEAVQVGFGDIRESLVNKPEKGHFDKAGVAVKRFVKEFRFDNAAEYTVGQEISVSGDSYNYPDSFDVIVFRDRVAVTVRDKKIESIEKIEDYTYTGLPVVNSRGFAVKAANESEYAQLRTELDAIKEGKEALNDTFFNKWTDFGTYRKIVFKDEVWEYVI